MASQPARHRYCRCGTRLAKDNPERQCSRCQHASRDKLIAPPEVPAEFWQTEQFRDAFAAQHIGGVARAYRTHPYHHAVYGPDGISQTLLGQWLGLRQPQVSRIETGPPIRNLDTLAYWARVLRIPAELLWFDMPGSTRRVLPAQDSAVGADEGADARAVGAAIQFWSIPTPDATAVIIDPAAHTASMAAVLTWAFMTDPDPGNLQRTNGSRVVSLADIEALHAMQCSLAALDAEHGGGAVLSMAMAYLRSEVVPLLRGRYPEHVGRRLFAAAAELTLTTGFIAYDAGQHGLARQQLVHALRLSRIAADRALGARVLTTMSHQALHLDDRDDALVFARAASSAVKDCAPAVQAICAVTEARALAVMGDKRACFGLMAETERAFSRARAEDAPAWLRFLDEAELTGKFGRCLRDLGLHADAERQLQTSLNLHRTTYPRSRAITQIIYATNHIRQGHLEPACHLGLAALPAVGRLRSQRTREYLRDLQAHLTPYAREPIVREFSEQAGEFLATRDV